MNTLHIKTGDNVQIMSGKDKGKQGKVLEVSPKEKKVIVEGRNLVTKHVKPRRQGEQGGLVKAEAPIYVFNLILLCFFFNKPTRVGHKVEGDKKVRVCKHCGAEL